MPSNKAAQWIARPRRDYDERGSWHSCGPAGAGTDQIRPPSTTKFCALHMRESSAASQSTRFATSCG
jgi:hypothetical protein